MFWSSSSKCGDPNGFEFDGIFKTNVLHPVWWFLWVLFFQVYDSFGITRKTPACTWWWRMGWDHLSPTFNQPFKWPNPFGFYDLVCSIFYVLITIMSADFVVTLAFSQKIQQYLEADADGMSHKLFGMFSNFTMNTCTLVLIYKICNQCIEISRREAILFIFPFSNEPIFISCTFTRLTTYNYNISSFTIKSCLIKCTFEHTRHNDIMNLHIFNI